MNEDKERIDLKSIYTSFLRNATEKEMEDFLVDFIERSDNDENIKMNTDEVRIHKFEKKSGIQFPAVVVNRAVTRLQERLNERIANLHAE